LEIVGTAPCTLADGTKEANKMAGSLEAMDLVISPRQELVEASEKEMMHLLCGAA